MCSPSILLPQATTKGKASSRERNWTFILTVAVLVAFLTAIIVMASVYATSGGDIPFHFGIVIDAGSSKTNVLLYKWAGGKHKGTGCVQQEKDSCNIKIPIAKAPNSSYMLPCLSTMKSHIKAGEVPTTPLYFAATAGMRLLDLSDHSKAENILNDVSRELNGTGLDLKSVGIISGHEEGLDGWITANFLKDTLEDPQKLDPWYPTTAGALDMGGASAQISYAVPPSDDVSNSTNDDIQRIQLYGQVHHVYSVSCLCFGRDEAERRHRAFMVLDPGNIDNVTDPCSPHGYTYAVTGQELFGQPCTNSDKFNKWLADDPALKSKNVTFVGKGDYDDCKKGMSTLLDANDCRSRNFKECFRKTSMQDQNQKFLAFATYFYTTSPLKLIDSTAEQFVIGTQEVCTKPYNATEHEKNKYMTSFCFNACYIYGVLFNGYGFTNTTWSNIQFLEKIDNKEVGWSLGYMIKATNLIPAKKPTPKFTSVSVFAACMAVLLSILVATIVFMIYNLGKRKSLSHDLEHNSYRTR